MNDRPRFYRLEPDHSVTPLADDDFGFIAWAEAFENGDARRVAFDQVAPGFEVSTVFLGLDHRFGNGPPLLFETMVFDDYGGGDQWRYSTWAEAVQGHNQAVAQLKERVGSADADNPSPPL